MTTQTADEWPSFDETIAGLIPDELASADPGATIVAHAVRTDDAGRELPAVDVTLDGDTGASTRGKLGGVSKDLELVAMIGSGGMGEVHLARQRSLQREVALKTTREARWGKRADALCHEAVVTGSLEHPNVVPVHAFGLAPDGRPVMVMQRVSGVSWKALLADESHAHWEHRPGGSFLERNLAILAQVCNAVAYAHDQGIVHRDLKPENVMVGAFGQVYVLDWGLAVREGHNPSPGGFRVVGTPAYLAPEMVAGHGVTKATDVFLLGSILHELLTGKPPNTGERLVSVLMAAYQADPREYDPDVPFELAELCKAAMTRSVSERLSSALRFRDALAEYDAHRSSRALCARADVRLADSADLSGAAAAVLLQARRAVSEAMVAFEAALESWPDNPAAREGLRRCAIRHAEIELAASDPEAARAALAGLSALGDPRPEGQPPDLAVPQELEEGIAALERAQVAAQRERQWLRSLAAEQDIGRGKWFRNVLFVILILVAFALTGFSLWLARTGEMTTRLVFWLVVSAAAIFLVIAVRFRRALFATAHNRRLTALAFGTFAGLIAHRGIGLLQGYEVSRVLTMDGAIFVVVYAFGGFTLSRLMWLGLLLTIGATLYCVFNPWIAGVLPLIAGMGVVPTVLKLGVAKLATDDSDLR